MLPRRVLLIAPQWPVRPLVKAELEHRGFDVLGADSIRLALDLCMKAGFKPGVVVVDSSGLSLDALDTARLRFLRGRSPLLLIRSSWRDEAVIEALSPDRELPRPVTVGQIADAVAEMAGRERQSPSGPEC